MRRLLRQTAGHLHQRHDQNTGAPAYYECYDHPPYRKHLVTPLLLFSRLTAPST